MREELIKNAVAFLTDPEVADKPLAKKIEFLESKEMTSQEIEEALKRFNESKSDQTKPDTSSRGVPAYVSYQRPAPLPPSRDWRDYFVMATVTGGVAYGLYEVARRYIVPLIMPPSPSSLEADKIALEAEFSRQEALLEQLQKDTEEMKQSEAQRAEQYQELTRQAREAITNLQQTSDKRDHDFGALKSQIDDIRETLPKALERQRGLQDKALEDLQNEFKSLKQLLSVRLKGATSTLPPIPPASSVPGAKSSSSIRSGSPDVGSPPVSTSPAPISASVQSISNGTIPLPDPAEDSASSSANTTDKPRSGIPAWQMAASRAKEVSGA